MDGLFDFLEIDALGLPMGMVPGGLVQLFYCTKHG